VDALSRKEHVHTTIVT
jgi:hypothetical protein